MKSKKKKRSKEDTISDVFLYKDLKYMKKLFLKYMCIFFPVMDLLLLNILHKNLSVISWKSNTPQSKICTSLSQTVIKFGMHICPTSKHLCLVLFILQNVFWVKGFKNITPTMVNKKGVLPRFLVNNFFWKCTYRNIKELITELMKFFFLAT
jgi:hypothetical protein